MTKQAAGPRQPPRLADDLTPGPFAPEDETELADLLVTGDHAGVEATGVELVGCRFERARLTGARLVACRLIDCVFVGCDLAGVVLDDDCRLTRVELRECRATGLQASRAACTDVGFLDCKLDSANFRMSTWRRAELRGCVLTDTDLYGATMRDARIEGCDLTGVQLTKADLKGSRLHGSTLQRIRGGDALRGVTIGSDQLVPAAVAVFAALGIAVADEEPEDDRP